VANLDRAVRVFGVLLMGMMAGFTLYAERIRFGRYVYATGGNIESAH